VSERDPSLHILQHALGLDEYGQRKGPEYRNRYVIGPDCDGWAMCIAHVEAGRMTRWDGCQSWTGGMSSFSVTELGRAYIREHSPPAPRMSRGKRRYQRWLDIADARPDMKFGEWLKAGEP
jgi:hypothetical protein